MTNILKHKRIIFGLICPALLVLASIVKDPSPARAISIPDELPQQKVVVIDPGHGGHDPGAVGPTGLAEKDVTLSVARKIKGILSRAYEVVLTREDDYMIDIVRRTGVANHHRADLFISIHSGGGFGHQAQGIVTFYYSPGTGPGSIPFRKEKDLWKVGERPPPWDEIQDKHRAKSQALAKLVHKHLLARLNPESRGIREAPLLVLRGADMPAILVEVGHLNHPAEEKNLRRPVVISATAEAICEAVKEFFAKYP